MDSEKLEIAIKQFYESHPKAFELGRFTKPEELQVIPGKVRKIIPDWYKSILLKYPLVDFEIGIPNDHGDDEFIGKPFEEFPLMGMTFLSVEEIANNALNIFPACELLRERIIIIAEDTNVTQEGVFINTKEDDPEVRLVFHDFGETGTEVFSKSELLLERFTDIFKFGKLIDENSG